MNARNIRYFVGDFETTVYEGQTNTLVWASALVEMNTEDVKICHSIQEQFQDILTIPGNITIYYHNLKFDGSFWLDYLMRWLHYEQAFTRDHEGRINGFVEDGDMKNRTFKMSISDMGQWYSIIIKQGNRLIELRDSLKLLPFTVKQIGKAFKTKHQKLDMKYEGLRFPGCEITPEEQAYIANDVLVVKEALEIMFAQGHNKMTIGACCMSEFKALSDKKEYDERFPDLYEEEIDENVYGAKTAGDYVRNSYHGGWCYVVKGKAGKIFAPKRGTTADVNSLYPSMMSSESGNYYPVGKPTFWKGNYLPLFCQNKNNNTYFFVRFKCTFKLKPGYLPVIQIKHNPRYKSTEWLSTSDVLLDGKYYHYVKKIDGTIEKATVTLTVTCTDFWLIQEHYYVDDFEILDGCWFYTEKGIFDEYINKYKKIKLESTGALRTLAKLFLNNLYGKLAASTNSSFKVASLVDGKIKLTNVDKHDKKPGYIPCGSAITSYARNFTIRAAQKNYHGDNAPGFIYADTDSIHCDLPPEDIQGITVHDKNFCCWKLESCWNRAVFVRQKTYIEFITEEDMQAVEKPYYQIRCAGMPEHCKQLLISSFTGETDNLDLDDLSKNELLFIEERRSMEDFTEGLIVPGKLRPERIEGGILLVNTTYEMR